MRDRSRDSYHPYHSTKIARLQGIITNRWGRHQTTIVTFAL